MTPETERSIKDTWRLNANALRPLLRKYGYARAPEVEDLWQMKPPLPGGWPNCNVDDMPKNSIRIVEFKLASSDLRLGMEVIASIGEDHVVVERWM